MRVRLSVCLLCIGLILTGAVALFGADDTLESVLQFSRMYDADQINAKGVFGAVAGWVDTTGKGIPIVVFNPSSWNRTDCVDVQSPFPGQNTVVSLLDDKGKIVYGQSQGDRLYFTAAGVPALGYKVYLAHRSKLTAKPAVTGKGFGIENQFLSVRVHPENGAISRILDKKYQRSLLPTDSFGGTPQIVSSCQIEPLIGNTEVVLMESGPARARITFDHYYNESQINEDVLLYDGIARMDLLVTVDWQESNKDDNKLQFTFPIPAELTEHQYGYPLGYTDDKRDAASSKVKQWVDLYAKDWGMTVCSSQPVFFEVSNGALNASMTNDLLRPAGTDAGDAPVLILSFYPRQGSIGADRLTRLAMQSLYPLKAVLTKTHKGTLPKSRSFLSLSNSTTVITKAVYNDYMGTLAITIHNAGTKNANTTLQTSCTYDSCSMENETRIPKPKTGGIDISIDPQAEKTVTLYR